MTTQNEAALVTSALAEFDKVAAGLAALEKSYKGVLYEVATREGMKAAVEARREIKAPRVALERCRREAKKPLLELGRKLDSEAKRITEALEALEDPIDLQIKTEEDRLHNEAVARAAAETRRIEELTARLDSISTMPYEAIGLPSAEVEKILKEARETVIGDDWQEFADKAHVALVATVAALEGVLAKAQATEAEAERIIVERAELARLQKAEADRQAAAKIIADQEAAKVAAEQRAEAIRLAAQAAEIKTAEAEVARARQALADEQEVARIAALPKPDPEPEIILTPEAASVERQRVYDNGFASHFARETKAEAQERREASIPSDEAIIQCVADHFRVSAAVAIEYIVSVAMNQEPA